MPHKITPEQMTNLQAALAAWNQVEPSTVNLDVWRARMDNRYQKPSCGSAACFGGWLPHFEHFKSLGVIADWDGAPMMRRDERLLPNTHISPELFGWGLFGAYEQGFQYVLPGGGLAVQYQDLEFATHHECVKHRLETAIKESFT